MANGNRGNTTGQSYVCQGLPHAAKRIRSKVGRLKEEKVVNPPQIPTMTKRRTLSEAGYLPLCSVSVPK
jgi:hypothetical protein